MKYMKKYKKKKDIKLIRIRTLKELINILEDSIDGCLDGYILLHKGLKSSKHISWNGESIFILNMIDGEEDIFNIEEFKESFIYESMLKGTFFIEK